MENTTSTPSITERLGENPPLDHFRERNEQQMAEASYVYVAYSPLADVIVDVLGLIDDRQRRR